MSWARHRLGDSLTNSSGRLVVEVLLFMYNIEALHHIAQKIANRCTATSPGKLGRGDHITLRGVISKTI
jgi:hypothetical protein